MTAEPRSRSVGLGKGSRPRKAFIYALSCLLLISSCWFLRGPLLTSLATAWVVDDAVQKADVIVVLGGRPEIRAVEAARLFHSNVAPRILYMDVKLPQDSVNTPAIRESELTRSLLLSNNVPEQALTLVGQEVASTYEESRAVRAWLGSNVASTILIPTDCSHTRRARWIFRKELHGIGAQVRVRALYPGDYGLTNWWTSKAGLWAFPSEWCKSAFYWVKY